MSPRICTAPLAAAVWPSAKRLRSNASLTASMPKRPWRGRIPTGPRRQGIIELDPIDGRFEQAEQKQLTMVAEESGSNSSRSPANRAAMNAAARGGGNSARRPLRQAGSHCQMATLSASDAAQAAAGGPNRPWHRAATGYSASAFVGSDAHQPLQRAAAARPAKPGCFRRKIGNKQIRARRFGCGPNSPPTSASRLEPSAPVGRRQQGHQRRPGPGPMPTSRRASSG